MSGIHPNTGSMNTSTGFKWWKDQGNSQPDDAATLLRINEGPKPPPSGPTTERKKQGCGTRYEDFICGPIQFYKPGWPVKLCPTCLGKIYQERQEREEAEKKNLAQTMSAMREKKRLENLKRQKNRATRRRTVIVKHEGAETSYATIKEAAAALGFKPNTVARWIKGYGITDFMVRYSDSTDYKVMTARKKGLWRPVVIMKDGVEKEYPTVSAVSREYNVDENSVRCWIRAGGSHSRKIRVRFADEDYTTLSPRYRGGNKPLPVRVFYHGLVEVYPTLKAASAAIGKTPKSIRNLIYYKRESMDGYRVEVVK